MDGWTEDFGDVGDERNLFLVEFGGIGRRTPPLTAVAFLDFFPFLFVNFAFMPLQRLLIT